MEEQKTKKLYITPNESGKFGYNSYYISTTPEEEFYLEATQEMIDGLKNHTLCWQGNELVPYVKTTEEIVQEYNKAQRQKINAEIKVLKANLSATDYKAIKFAEGEMTAEEYAETKAERQSWRARINELELQLTLI